MSTTEVIQPRRPLSPAAQMLRQFIDQNWFFVLSGILMVIGCHQLVRSVLVTGSELVRTGISLGILQAYEVLVICTAIVIVRKLRILGDAFTLFIIECALLLDPTFFSNSLGTIAGGDGLWINVLVFVLCPLKLLVLQRFLRIRVSLWAWLAFIGMAAVIYLAPWVYMIKRPVLTMHGNYLLVGYILLGLTALMPPVDRIGSISAADPAYSTPGQRKWLRAFGWACRCSLPSATTLRVPAFIRSHSRRGSSPPSFLCFPHCLRTTPGATNPSHRI